MASELLGWKLLNIFLLLDFWDTAGQERFSNMHPSYYHQAHACILVSSVDYEMLMHLVSDYEIKGNYDYNCVS